jgi:release factor glutamine methyltransferase
LPERDAVPTVTAMVSEVLRNAQGRLERAGCDTPRLDAEVLLAFLLGCDRAGLVLAGRNELPVAAKDRFSELIARRCAREPVAYIVGRREFRGISLTVDRRVLIPRPETELLVEVGLSLADGISVADVGTGSGAVALALKHERPDLTITGLDLSDDAVAVAGANASRLGLDVCFLQADLLDDPSRYDAVLANLPYVAAGEASALAPEITRYEPAEALFAGADGLELIRRLIAGVAEVPLIALEVGLGQADAVVSLLADAGFDSVVAVRDLAGIERVAVGRR